MSKPNPLAIPWLESTPCPFCQQPVIVTTKQPQSAGGDLLTMRWYEDGDKWWYCGECCSCGPVLVSLAPQLKEK